MSALPSQDTHTQTVNYCNLLDDLRFEAQKPNIEAMAEWPGAQVKRVTLKEDTELKCHQTRDHVLVVWLRGKARFQAGGETFVMHPGSMLEMPSGTPHGAQAETDCVFLVIKARTGE